MVASAAVALPTFTRL